jgi:hypothetical protein
MSSEDASAAPVLDAPTSTTDMSCSGGDDVGDGTSTTTTSTGSNSPTSSTTTTSTTTSTSSSSTKASRRRRRKPKEKKEPCLRGVPSETPSNPFESLRISSHDCLTQVDGRYQCPGCQRSRKYYCYSCRTWMGGVNASDIPRIRLPVELHMYACNHGTQHNTTQHNTTQHNTTQHNTTQHNTTQHNTMDLLMIGDAAIRHTTCYRCQVFTIRPRRSARVQRSMRKCWHPMT